MAAKSALTSERGRWNGTKVHAACRAGDERAWQLVYAKTLAVTSRRGWRLDRDDAADLAQQAVLRIIERIDDVRDPVAFEAFVRTVTERLVLSFLAPPPVRIERLDQDFSENPGRPVSPEPSVDPEGALLAAVEIGFIDRAFERIPEDCGAKIRAWLDWKEFGAYASEREAAAVFGQSLGTFSARVSRCLEFLQAVMGMEEVAA